MHTERIAFICSFGGEYRIEKMAYEQLKRECYTYSSDHGKTWAKCEKAAT